MYKLYIIDKNKRKLNVFETNSEYKMDCFTTCFDSESDLLEKIGLDSKDYRVRVEKANKEEVKGEIVPLISSNYLELSNFDNREGLTNFYSTAEKVDIDIIKSFFLNELVLLNERIESKSESNNNNYDEDKEKQVNNVIRNLELLEDGKSTKISVSGLFSMYFGSHSQKENKPNYQAIKRFYKFLVDTKAIANSKSKKDIDENEIKNIKDKIDESMSLNGDSFKMSLPMDIVNPITFEEDEIENIMTRSRDIDELHSEIDIYYDDKNIDEETKINKINKNIKKYK